MQQEGRFWDAIELSQTAFGKAPKRLDAIHAMSTIDELIVPVIDAEVLIVADIDQAFVAGPTVGVHHGVRGDFASNNGLQRGFFAIRNDFGVDAIAAFEESEDDSFTTGTATAFTTNASGAKVRFVGFDGTGEGRLTLAFLGDAVANFEIDRIDRTQADAGQMGGFRGGQIE